MATDLQKKAMRLAQLIESAPAGGVWHDAKTSVLAAKAASVKPPHFYVTQGGKRYRVTVEEVTA